MFITKCFTTNHILLVSAINVVFNTCGGNDFAVVYCVPCCFALTPGVIIRLRSVILVNLRHLLYCFTHDGALFTKQMTQYFAKSFSEYVNYLQWTLL